MTAAGPATSRAAELGGAGVRRLTRRAAATRAGTTLWARLGDAVGALVSVAVGLAVVGGSVGSLRERIAAAASPVAGLPTGLFALAAAVLAVAGLVGTLDRLGPVSSTAASAAWWLPLPASRRSLLTGELRRITLVAVGAAVLVAFPLGLAVPEHPAPGTLLLALGWAAAGAAAAVGGTALLQTRGRGGRLAAPAGAVGVATAVLAAGVGTAAAMGHGFTGAASLPRPPPWTPVLPGLLAGALLGAAARGLDRLGYERLRAHGATAEYATASVLSLDTRDLGRALSGRQRRPRRSRRFPRVRRPWQALLAVDLVILARGRWQQGQLVAAVAVPVVVARTEGLGALPLAVWIACLLGWALAAVAAGHPARQAQAAPVLDRLLPVSAGTVVRLRGVLPMALTAAVCGLTGLLLGLAGGGVPAWTALCLAAAPAWAAAAVRGAYRPGLDWSGPVMSTPMGALPVGVGATLVQGPDVGVVGTLPLGGALLTGGPSPGLIALQLAWSAGLAVLALGAVARRRGRPE